MLWKNLFHVLFQAFFPVNIDLVPKDQSVIHLPTKLRFSLIKPSVGEQIICVSDCF